MGVSCLSLCRFEELVKKFKVEYHAGGATQNSIKIAQVSHGYTNSTTPALSQRQCSLDFSCKFWPP